MLFWLVLGGVVALCGLVAVWQRVQPVVEPLDSLGLYEVAMLHTGSTRVLAVALSVMVVERKLQAEASGPAAVPDDVTASDDFQAVIVDRVRATGRIPEPVDFAECAPVVALKRRLIRAGLLRSRARTRYSLKVLWLYLVPLLVGSGLHGQDEGALLTTSIVVLVTWLCSAVPLIGGATDVTDRGTRAVTGVLRLDGVRSDLLGVARVGFYALAEREAVLRLRQHLARSTRTEDLPGY
ncbi:hypothetical protein [Actinosynnema sp. NPDC020468]|uniref:hypothetical protein n=1 Tax=Actinosynnema sp. NPDC020468 TaxID=3154488 RepID=UPI0034032C24